MTMTRRENTPSGALDGVEIRYREGEPVAFVSLWYPRSEGHPKEIDLGLMDVRAADSIRISYDFARDGWVIKQASRFEWPAGDTVMDEDWQEVAFVQAWGREEERTGEHSEKKT